VFTLPYSNPLLLRLTTEPARRMDDDADAGRTTPPPDALLGDDGTDAEQLDEAFAPLPEGESL
jgi:hypothetical protein